MSTLKVTNIQATGETASRAVSGVAAAWVNFNGTGTIAVRDSQNVSGLVDNGTGDYTVNFSSNMGNANYAWSGFGDYTAGSAQAGVINQRGTLSASATQFAALKLGATYTRFDTGYSIKIHGDLA
tara:strand:- start:1082 stop:1456 length:375 start_codon:yes stop_codon:yes gene_type:complete